MLMGSASSACAALTCRKHYTSATAYVGRSESDIQERCFTDTYLCAVGLMFLGKANNTYAAGTCSKHYTEVTAYVLRNASDIQGFGAVSQTSVCRQLI